MANETMEALRRPGDLWNPYLRSAPEYVPLPRRPEEYGPFRPYLSLPLFTAEYCPGRVDWAYVGHDIDVFEIRMRSWGAALLRIAARASVVPALWCAWQLLRVVRWW
jgi:hypothetical protein